MVNLIKSLYFGLSGYMRKILTFIVLLSITFLPGAICAQEEESRLVLPPELQIYDNPEVAIKLIALEQSGAHDQVFEAVRNISDGNEMKEALLWLRTRVMADNTYDPRYALLYAESLQRIIGGEQEGNLPLMETAAMVFLYGHLTLAVDAQRCLDREATWVTINLLTEPFSHLTEFYKALPEHKRRDILTVAMRLEDRISGRPPNSWICTGKNPEKLQQDELALEKDRLSRMETEIYSLMQELDLQPQYVSSRIWRERRDSRRRSFARQFH